MAVHDLWIAADGHDVAVLHVPLRFGVRRHLPLEVNLDLGLALRLADVLRQACANGPFRKHPPSQIDLFFAGSELALERNLVDLDTAAVRDHVDRVRKDRGTRLQHLRDLRIVHRTPVTVLLPGIDRVMTRDVDRFDHLNVVDTRQACRVHDRKDLRQPRVHTGTIERCVAALTCLIDELGRLATRGVRVVPVTGIASDPIRRRNDIDAALEQPAEKIDVRPDTEVRHAVGLGGDDVVDTARCQYADGIDPDDLTRIAANLVLAVAIEPD